MAKGKSQDQATVAEELKDQTPAIEQEPAAVTGEPVTESQDQIVQEPESQAQEPESVEGLDAEEPAEPAEVTNQDPEQSGAQEGDEDTLVSVSNAAKSSLRQPSSGLVIEPGKTRKLLKDGWLENQLNANLLVLV